METGAFLIFNASEGGQAISERLKKNDEITGKTARVIGPTGDQLGIMLIEQALMKAKEADLDLVEVAPKATPPVCKIMDYGKQVYQSQKKTQNARKKTHANEMKEVRLKTRIGQHDLDIKLNRARKFLGLGHRVRFTMIYKGREITHREIGEEILVRVVEALKDESKIERPPFREGRNLALIVAPIQKNP